MEDVKYILKPASDDELSLKVLLTALIKRAKWIMAFSLICTLLAGVYAFVKPNYYESQAIITSNMFSLNEILPILTANGELVKDHSPKALSKLFNVTEAQTETIQKVTFEPVKPEEPGAKFILEIELQGTDTNILPSALSQLITDLNNNNYLARKLEKRSLQLDTLIHNINHQIKELKAFKSETRNAMNSAEGVMIYPVSIHTELLNLQDRLLLLTTEKRDLSMVEFIQEPTYPNKPKGPNRLLIILATLATSLALAVFIVIGLVVFEP